MNDATLNIEFEFNTAEAINETKKIKDGINNVNEGAKKTPVVLKDTEGILQRLQRAADLYKKGMQEATRPENLEKYSQKLSLVNTEMNKLTKGVNLNSTSNQWNGLQNSINQIGRELPAFTYSIQTGFMAISNNLPIFADEIGRIRKENEALNASGQKGVPVWKQLLSGLLSWQTAMSIGITLLTVYGKEIGKWTKGIFGTGKKLEDLRESVESINEVLKDSVYKDAVSNVKNLDIAVSLAKQGFVSKKSVVEEYNKTIGRTTGEVKSLDEVERFLVSNSDNYIKMTLYKAAANLQLAEAAKEAAAIQENSAKEAAEFATKSDSFFSIIKTGGAGKLYAKLVGKDTEYYEDLMTEAGTKRKNIEQSEHEKREKQLTDNAESLLRKSQEYASKIGITVFGNGKEKQDASDLKTAYVEISKISEEGFEKIKALNYKYSLIDLSDTDREKEMLKQEFDEFRKIIEDENKKITKLNKEHKINKPLINISSIDTVEKKAESQLAYKQDTEVLLKELNIRQKLVEDYNKLASPLSGKYILTKYFKK